MSRKRVLACWISGLGLWVALCSSYAQPAFPRYFLVSYGDNTLVFDGASSVDSLAFYSAYTTPCFVDWVQNAHGNGMGMMDELSGPLNRAYPFVLYGYPPLSSPLDRRGVEEAFLRFDVLYDPGRGLFDTEDICFWDERSCAPNVIPASFAYGSRLVELLQAHGQAQRGQRISITINLITGCAYAQELDVTGNPRRDYGALPDCWGARGRGDRGTPATVLALAADGNLYGRIADDLVPSFVAFGIKLACPPDPWRLGDVNGDNIVDDADLLIVLFNFGTQIRCSRVGE